MVEIRLATAKLTTENICPDVRGVVQRQRAEANHEYQNSG